MQLPCELGLSIPTLVSCVLDSLWYYSRALLANRSSTGAVGVGQMYWKARIRYAVPTSVVNGILLSFPFLYRTKLVNYESGLQVAGGLDDLLSQLRLVVDLPGNVIECGSSLCGSSIIMANFLRSKGSDKKVYACDSFKGFDPVELDRERGAGLASSQDWEFRATSYQYVARKIGRLGLEDVVIPTPGYFQDTLASIESDYCLALIDCDLEDSTFFCAETVWAKTVEKGRLLFDDYASEKFQGARLGIERFVSTYQDQILDQGLLNRLYWVSKK